MTDIEGFLTMYGHSENLLNNNIRYPARPRRIIVNYPNLYECLFDLCKISISVTLQFECHKVSQMNVAKQRNYKGLYGDLHGCINFNT